MIPSQVYAQPAMAAQKPGPTPLAELAATSYRFPGDASEQHLDGNDQRLQQLMFSRGKLFTAVGTAAVSGGSPVRDAAAWFVIEVKNPRSGPQARVVAEGYVAGPDSSHLVYPAVAVNALGEAAMVFKGQSAFGRVTEQRANLPVKRFCRSDHRGSCPRRGHAAALCPCPL